MLFWIVLVIALAAAAAVGWVFFTHWKEIRLLDPNTIKSEQERKEREEIVQHRLDQRLKRAAAPVERAARLLVQRARRVYRRTEERLLAAAGMEEMRQKSVERVSSAVRTLLKSATHAVNRGALGEAERIYLEILKQDSRHVEAYRGLGALYMQQRSYAQAKETFSFLERLKGCDDACYASLAEIARSEGNTADAEAFYRRAIEVVPENAERHVALAAFYVAQGQGSKAQAVAAQAVALDPENVAALELSVEAAILVRDPAEAEARYEQLRPRSRDRQKLQSLREKLEAMEAPKS